MNIENTDYYLVFLDKNTLQIVENNNDKELFAFDVDNFINSISLTCNQFPDAWIILFKVIEYYINPINKIKTNQNKLVKYITLLYNSHTHYINLVITKLSLIEIKHREGQLGFERDYYNASKKYLQTLLEPSFWNQIRSNNIFPSDEEEEMKFVYRYEKAIDKNRDYIQNTSHPLTNEYNLRIKSIYDFLLERYNFKEAYKFMSNLRPTGKFLYAINCPHVILLLILITIFGYLTNLVTLLQLGILGVLGLGIFYILVYPLFYLIFRYNSAYHDLSLIAPKFIISILIGWVALLPFADEIWKLNMSTIDSPGLFYFIIFTLGMIIYSFIFYELKMVKPFISLRESVSRISRLFSIGFPVSILAGLLFMSFSFVPNLGESKFYSDNVASSRLIRDVENIEAEYKKSVEDYYILSYLRQEKNLDSMKIRLLLVGSCIKDKIRFDRMNMPKVQYYVDSSYFEALDKSEKLYKSKKEKIYAKLCEYESKEWTKKGNNSFCCMKIPYLMNLYIFPKLLLLMSLTTFLLGYFIQFVFEGRSLRKN